jgi:transposase
MIRTTLSEAMWGRLAPLLPPQKPWTGRPSLDHRRFLEAVLWLARTGAPWRDLPPALMNWRTAWRRLQRWTAAGVWERVVDALRAMAPDAGWEAHILDSSVIRAHAHAAGARRRTGGQALGRSRGGFSTKLHLRCDANGLPLAIVLTPGQRHEMRAFDMLVEGMARGTRCLIGDMGYDADRARQDLLLRGVLPVIPSNPARKEPLPLDRALYRMRNRVERLNNKLKQFRAVATRYDKTAASYLAFVQLAASRLWLRFVHTA